MKRKTRREKKQETIKGMTLYPACDCAMTYQNFGSAWLIVLRGATDNILDTFNGLYNFAATEGELEFQDHLESVAVFWSEYKQMRRYFFNRYYIPQCDGNKRGQRSLIRKALDYAYSQLELMSKTCHELYLDYSEAFEPETYGSGVVCAERPDADMKDAILANAFKEKDTGTSKVVDTE